MQKNETDTFIRILHHSENGKIAVQRLSQENKPQLLTKDVATAVGFALAEPTEDTYVCLNSMRGTRRSIANTHAINGFFIDLDKHPAEELPPETAENMIKTAKQRSYELLSNAIESGKIPKPTMITETRRGYGLYYIYERPIAHTENATGLIKCHDYTYRRVMKKFEALLSDPSLLEVDHAVANKDRLCRVPGTYAHGTDFRCKLIKADETYYTLTSLRDAFGIKDREENPAERKRSYLRARKVVDLSEYKTAGMIAHRLDALDNIVADKLEKGILSGYRELYLFWTYNYLAQVMPEQEAIAAIRKLNTVKFSGAVNANDLNCIFRSVKKKKYRITNDTLQMVFDLSMKDAEKVGLGTYQKKRQREASKRETRKTKELQKALIREYKPVFKRREQLLGTVNKRLEAEGYKPISMTTLDRRLKELGLNREGTLAYTETAEYKREKERKASNANKKIIRLDEKNEEIKKFPKSAPVSSSLSKGERSEPRDFRHYAENRAYYETASLLSLLDRHDTRLGAFYENLYVGSLGQTWSKDVWNVLSHLGYDNRTRAVHTVQALYSLYQQNGLTEGNVIALLENRYKKPVREITFSYKNKTPEQKAHYRRFFANQQVWTWVLSPVDKTEQEKQVAHAYQSLNRQCKLAIADGREQEEFIPGYSYGSFKKKVIFYLTLDQLKQLAANGAPVTARVLASLVS